MSLTRTILTESSLTHGTCIRENGRRGIRDNGLQNFQESLLLREAEKEVEIGDRSEINPGLFLHLRWEKFSMLMGNDQVESKETEDIKEAGKNG